MRLPHVTTRTLANGVAAAALLVAPCPGVAPADSPTPARAVEARIDAGKTGAPISPLVYGQFIEHIGSLINHGLWAEMLDDRKFYSPVLAAEPKPEPTRFGRTPPRRWTSVGPLASVEMDTNDPFVGEHSPLVKLDPTEAHGIRQAGLAVVAGRSYTGRVVLAGSDGAHVQVRLAWGSGADERQSVDVGPLTDAYATFPLGFTARADRTDARLEISATGRGSFRVGAVSLMPADNVEGFRAEVIAALRSLRSGVYRFPGGNFVSAHEWRDAIGDRDRRRPVLDPVWNAVQPNDVGTDEFMTLCRLLDVEPYITVNAGFGDAWSAAQYVEYANGAKSTPMGRLRAANGHPAPYRVRYWGIGNEAWGGWQFGAMVLEQFVHKHNQFARAMRRVDPTIVLIGSGAMPDAMTGSKQSLRLGDKLVPEYLSPADWTGGLFLHCLQNMDMISEHFYSYAGTRFDLEKAEQVPVDPDEPLVDWMRRPANHVREKVEAYHDYLELIPALREKRIPIALDEWAYARVPPNSYKVVPAYAWVFHEMFRASDLFGMANFTFATSLVSATRTEAVLDPAGLLFKLYRDHFGSIPVAVSGNSPSPAPRYPPGGEQPKVNAGSPTFPLDVAAAWTGDRASLTVAVINPTKAPQRLDLSVAGADLAGRGTLWRMAPPDLDATIVVGKKPGVEVEEHVLDAVPTSLTLPPFSVSLYALPAR
jgi:alpha-N-arabinofuranosidase